MKLLPLLFSTYSNNQTPIPKQNQFILGISSLWILTIVYKTSLLLSLNIILISIISPLFWYKYKLNSIFHKLDKLLVWTIVIQNIINYSIYLSTSIPLISLTILFFYLSEYFIINKKFKCQLLSHLLFRYFFFIWIYINLYENLNYLSYISIGYLSHNYYLFKNIRNYNLWNYIYYLSELSIIIYIYLNN